MKNWYFLNVSDDEVSFERLKQDPKVACYADYKLFCRIEDIEHMATIYGLTDIDYEVVDSDSFWAELEDAYSFMGGVNGVGDKLQFIELYDVIEKAVEIFHSFNAEQVNNLDLVQLMKQATISTLIPALEKALSEVKEIA